jgi:hypothetical protein
MKMQDTMSFSTSIGMIISVLVYDCVKRIMKSKILKIYFSFSFMVTSLEQYLNYFSISFVIDILFTLTSDIYLLIFFL